MMDEQKKLVVTLVTMIGVAVVILGVLLYQMNTLGVPPLDGEESINAEIAKAETELKRLTKLSTQELPQAKKELEDLSGMEADARQLLPKVVLTEEVLKFINAKAEEARVEILGIDPTKVKKKSGGFRRGPAEPYEEKVYRMIVTGSYDQIALFVNYMEMFELSVDGQKPEKRFFKIRDIKLHSKELGLSETLSHVATLDVATYQYKEVKSRRGVRR
ncbi:MAG: type 4a pilus biogenesis protein PilO [Planctomycetota bacterium]|jgi:Tfp pilus assembly protein PilO